MKAVTCIDCRTEGVTIARPTPHGGPRSPLCVTHWRARRKRTKAIAHGRRLTKAFGMTPQQYAVLYALQGGKCFICQWATGATKKLAVDHDHTICDDHPADQGCPACWRALLCGPCNQLIGRLGVEALQRAIVVLTDPPARGVFER